MRRKIRIGRTIRYGGGMSADVVSDHVIWIDELQRRALAHDDLILALRRIVQECNAPTDLTERALLTAIGRFASAAIKNAGQS